MANKTHSKGIHIDAATMRKIEKAEQEICNLVWIWAVDETQRLLTQFPQVHAIRYDKGGGVDLLDAELNEMPSTWQTSDDWQHEVYRVASRITALYKRYNSIHLGERGSDLITVTTFNNHPW